MEYWITITLKDGRQLKAFSNRPADRIKKNIIEGHPKSGLTGLMWNNGDGTYTDYSAEQVRSVTGKPIVAR